MLTIEPTNEKFPRFIRRPVRFGHATTCYKINGKHADWDVGIAVFRNGEIRLMRWGENLTLEQCRERWKTDRSVRFVYTGMIHLPARPNFEQIID